MVCEGKVTEPGYIGAFQHHCRNQRVHVHVHKEHGVPLTVVQEAVNERLSAQNKARLQKDANLEFDAVWAVFDVDDHPNLAEAVSLAEREGIQLAVSNPCFELWALLHFDDHRKQIGRKKLRARLKKYLEDYEKSLDFAKLIDGYEDAKSRAKELDRVATTTGNLGGNPSTAVYLLTEMIRTK